jgi:DNA repair exonuclease SbcCD ATPase subunit
MPARLSLETRRLRPAAERHTAVITRIVIKGYRIFQDFEFCPNAGTNIVVGDNDSGKSTLLEAIALALTGRIYNR